MGAEQFEVVRHPDLCPALAEDGFGEVDAVEREEHPFVLSRWDNLGRSSDRGPPFRHGASRWQLGVDVHDAICAHDRACSIWAAGKSEAPAAMKASWSTSAPFTFAPGPIITSVPIETGSCGQARTTAFSMITVRAPTRTGASSATRTAPNMILQSSPISTSPQTTAVGAMYADSATLRCDSPVLDQHQPAPCSRLACSSIRS